MGPALAWWKCTTAAVGRRRTAGIFTALGPPGQFTAIVAGKNGGIGIALVEIYNLK